MIIKSLEIKNLHGTINIKKNFHDGINLLVGINGSGKTSALNAISWLLRPSVHDLVTTEFNEMILCCEKDGVQITINAKQTQKTVRINLKVGELQYKPLQITLRYPTAKLRDDPLLSEQARIEYMSLVPSAVEADTWTYFQTLIKPIVISLDRNIAIQTPESYALERGRKNPNRGKEILDVSPISQVSKITQIQYIKYKNKIIELNEQLKEKILLSSFETAGLQTTKTKHSSFPKLQEIETIERKVLHHLPQWIRDVGAHKKVETYFKQLKQVVTKFSGFETNDVFHFGGMYRKEITRLNELASAFNEYESNSTLILESISKYLKIVNSFFKDSGKQLVFDDTTNQIHFRFINIKSEFIGEPRHIEHLSSGERQILILMTYVCFPPETGSLLIIDEPELSLHPKWQRDFLSSVNSLMPSGNQIILATHSPEIVGRNKEKCIVLNPIEI